MIFGACMINALTIDVEHWWMNDIVYRNVKKNNTELLEKQVKYIVDILDEYNCKATFFILGNVALNNMELVENIYDHGHEIACHGFSHINLNKLNPKLFEKEIIKCNKILNKYSPKGFRAPYFSLNNNTKWILPILKKYNYKYDSSIFPIINPYYGVPKAPCQFYPISFNDVRKIDTHQTFIEFPMSVYEIGFINLPVSGGFYLRILPISIINHAIRKINFKIISPFCVKNCSMDRLYPVVKLFQSSTTGLYNNSPA